MTYADPAPGTTGKTISVMRSPWSRAVENGPWKKSEAATRPLAARRAHDELGPEREHDRGEIGCGIGVGEAPADRAAVANLQVTDLGRTVRDCGERLSAQVARAGELVPRRERADASLVPVHAYAVKLEAADVHEHARSDDAQLQHREERLPAREHLRIRVCECCQCIVERRCAPMLERCGDHAPTAARTESTIVW